MFHHLLTTAFPLPVAWEVHIPKSRTGPVIQDPHHSQLRYRPYRSRKPTASTTSFRVERDVQRSILEVTQLWTSLDDYQEALRRWTKFQQLPFL